MCVCARSCARVRTAVLRGPAHLLIASTRRVSLAVDVSARHRPAAVSRSGLRWVPCEVHLCRSLADRATAYARLVWDVRAGRAPGARRHRFNCKRRLRARCAAGEPACQIERVSEDAHHAGGERLPCAHRWPANELATVGAQPAPITPSLEILRAVAWSPWRLRERSRVNGLGARMAKTPYIAIPRAG